MPTPQLVVIGNGMAGARAVEEILARWESVVEPDLHPLFTLRPGAVEPWEKA